MLDLKLWQKIYDAARDNDVSTLRALLSRRPSPETLNHGGPKCVDSTPLHRASSEGFLEVVRLLVKAGANVHVTDKYGNTPLHLASYNGRLEVAQLLVEAGANVDATNTDDKTPRQWALANEYYEVADWLTEVAKTQRAALQKAEEPRRQNAEQYAELQREIQKLKAALAAQQAELEQAGRLNTALTSRVSDLERANTELTEKLASMQPQKTKDTTNYMSYNQFSGQAPQIYY